MAAPRTLYQTLNVSPDAEPVVIEAAYRALMKKYHPDQGAPTGEGGPSAAEINNAFAVLRDPERRAEYDHKEWAHKEWARQQAIQIASYPALPPPRRSNFFGWGGWLVALALAVMIAIMARNGVEIPLTETEQARSAMLGAPDLRSQPLAPGTPVISPAEAAEIQADAMLGRQAPAAAPRSAEAPRAESASARPNVRKPAYVRRPLYRSRRARAPRNRAHQDFLQRQGYIY